MDLIIIPENYISEIIEMFRNFFFFIKNIRLSYRLSYQPCQNIKHCPFQKEKPLLSLISISSNTSTKLLLRVSYPFLLERKISTRIISRYLIATTKLQLQFDQLQRAIIDIFL